MAREKKNSFLWSELKLYEVSLDNDIRSTLSFHLPLCMTPEWERTEYCAALWSCREVVRDALREA